MTDRLVMRAVFSLFVLFAGAARLTAVEQAGQDDAQPGFSFLPGPTLFPPLLAHYEEPRFGLRKEIATSKIKLDIGDAIDLVEFRPFHNGQERIRAGGDFFTYALTTSWQGHRLQVDAVDGLFGGHIVYRAPGGLEPLTLRVRILHLSAHFVDGHYDPISGQWIDGRPPIPFTRDFGELTAAYTTQLDRLSLMAYSGLGYATLVRPADVRRFSSLHGVQLHSDGWPGPVFGKPCILYAADDFTLKGVPKYVGSNSLEIGAKFGEWTGYGVKLYMSYYSGLSIFSEYYNVRWDQWGLGFAFDIL